MELSLSNYIPKIIQLLKAAINPYRIFIFGSVASGTESRDSDLDLAVILDSEYIHTSYDEKMETKLKVRKALEEINYEIPIDLLVYSKQEFEKLQEINPVWANEITTHGKVIYEKNHQ